jgi:hypothetical protein
MEPLSEALRMLRRQSELETAMRKPGGIKVMEERELYALQADLAKVPAAARAVLEAARRLHRPVDVLTVREIEELEAGIH